MAGLSGQSTTEFLRFFERYAIWWTGIQGGGAVQDDLVFAGMAGMLFWFLGLLTAWMARRGMSGLATALPTLWMTGTLLIYTRQGRLVVAAALLLAIALQLLLDQQRLFDRWNRRGYDYSSDVMLDRYLMAGGLALVVVLSTAALPNLSVDPIARRYYEVLAPFNQEAEALAERLFPDIEGSGRRFGRGVAGGLPNEFLLQAGSDLGEDEVMRVRTSDAVVEAEYGQALPPPGHYMRSATYSIYDGLGWDNPFIDERMPLAANERWTEIEWQGRRDLVQSVVLTFNTNVLFAAAEPMEPTLDYSARIRADGDLIALAARARSYNIVSSIPAVSDETMASLPGWGDENPLPAEYEGHLQLPDTVTERTRQLAEELTGHLDSPYAKATAIESYLRTYEYDLSVPEPPPGVTDVTDFFLFELKRGYCDYYATAFVTLARLAGLPTRFATGYAVGSWDGFDRVWVVSEAEAHSWPEVLFPEVGWIPFEPTAGRPSLTRIGLPQASSSGPANAGQPTVEEIEAPGIDWNWQMLVWLLPLGLLVWGTVKIVGGWHRGRQDPWESLLRWGNRAGRPIEEGETALEYGDGLAAYVIAHQQSEPDTGRHVAREVQGLSDDVTAIQYAPAAHRQPALDRANERWQRLRGYLRRLRMG